MICNQQRRTDIGLKEALSKTNFVALRFGAVCLDPVIDVLLNVESLPAFCL